MENYKYIVTGKIDNRAKIKPIKKKKGSNPLVVFLNAQAKKLILSLP